MQRRRSEFLALVARDPARRYYGVNVHAGDGSDRVMTEAEQRGYERGLHSGTSFGEPLPRRVSRGIVLARLANYVGGHAGVSVKLVADGGGAARRSPAAPGPALRQRRTGRDPGAGAGCSPMSPMRWKLGIKEGMALINGSPCAAALLADSVLCAEHVLEVAVPVFAMACAAVGVPDATFDARLEALWGDPYDARALRWLRELLEDRDHLAGHDHVQPAVSFRVLPRVLGALLRALAGAREAAEVGLSAVSDNPVFVFEDGDDVISNGGFHNGSAPGCIDRLTAAMADLAQLAQHQVQRVQTDPQALPGLDSLALGTMQMVAAGYAEEARAAVVPSLLPLPGFGQNDAPAPSFHAWNRMERVRGFVIGSLTCLAVLAAQALARPERRAPPALAQLLATVLDACPPVDQRRSLGPDLGRLAELLGAGVPD